MNDNRLIAEFMGMEKERHADGRYLFTNDLEEAKGTDTRFTEELYFHLSWDWLMPVVDKIESMRGVYRIGGMTKGGQLHNATEKKYVIEYGMHDKVIAHVYANSRIDAEYQAVVEFIKEFNLKS